MWRRIPILKRLIPSLRKRLAQLTWTDGFAIVRSGEARLLVNYRNYVDRQIAFHGDFEAEQLAYFLEHMRRYVSTTFIDIGANIGFYLVHIALSAPAARLIAFEPDARNHYQLRANVFLNGLSNRAEIHQVALSDRTGKVAFQAFADTSTGQSRVAAGRTGIEVDAVRLDDVLDFASQNVAIKIDIEGHEVPAFQGMRDLLGRNKCFIQAEIYPQRLAQARSLLGEIGYREIHAIGHDHYFLNFPEE
jgi:FkbM family methyltransferase